MAAAEFQLKPFGATGAPGIEIGGTVERHGGLLQLEIRVAAPAGDGPAAIVWPCADQPPQRHDGLWRHTCLEMFLTHPDDEGYWEFNLAPNGHWNVYQLEGYRRGLRPDLHYTSLPFNISQQGGRTALVLRCPLPAPLAQRRPLQLAITAVLEHRADPTSYWALHHGGLEADFHRRDGFQLVL
jgi:hypothetical protein